MIGALLGYLPLLLATLASELPIVAIALRGPHRARALRVCVAANLLTHPLATLAAWHLSLDVFWIEAVVTLVEAYAYERLARATMLRSLLVAIVANALSWLGGMLLATLLAG